MRSGPSRLVGLLAAAVVAALLGPGARAQADAYVLATGATSAVSAMPKEDLRKILIGQVQSWPDGTPVVLVVAPDSSPAMDWVIARYVGSTKGLYRRYLQEKCYRAGLSSPVFAPSEAEVTSAIRQRKGAIGPVPRAALGSDLKEVAIR